MHEPAHLECFHLLGLPEHPRALHLGPGGLVLCITVHLCVLGSMPAKLGSSASPFLQGPSTEVQNKLDGDFPPPPRKVDKTRAEVTRS